MNEHTLAFIFGALLLLIGILGGGFEVKELKLPKVGWSIRLISSILGAFFIAIGLKIINVPWPDHNNGDKKISELKGRIRDVDSQIQNLNKQLASIPEPPGLLHELRDMGQQREGRLAEIQGRREQLISEMEQLLTHKNGDPGAKRRIEQIQGESIPDLDDEIRSVQKELKESHEKIRNAERLDELGGRINRLNEEKKSLQEEMDRLTRKIQPIMDSGG